MEPKLGAMRLWREWFAQRGWHPLPFQETVWQALEAGRSGLLQMPTGAGKTYAVYGAALAEAMEHTGRGLKVLYVTPLRALSRDIEKALRAPVEEMGWKVTVGARTGDTSSSARAKQKKLLPDVLVTTPESLALLLSYPTAAQDMASVCTVIIDEWHELLATKRGSLLELSLSRLRELSPQVKTWALSATLANTHEAAQAAVGTGRNAELVSSPFRREVIIDSLLPEKVERFPWAGHLGLKMLPQVLAQLEGTDSTLLFTNTRSQAERWYRALVEARPEWTEKMALHHGSLDKGERESVEAGLKDGTLRLAVCTSSLDLGIDLAPVQQVIQIGSPKGIARLIQRAGRAAHTPGAACRIFFVPTHALELVEVAAAREAVEKGEIESRTPVSKPLDVLSQHLVTLAMGGGFEKQAVLEAVRGAYSFRDLSEQELDWTLALVEHGGSCLGAYPDYHKVVLHEGRYQIASKTITQIHRQNIGTITSDTAVQVRFTKGATLGSVEESFVTRMKKGETFMFAGKHLELVMVRDMVAYVRKAKGKPQNTPRWYGGKMPLSPCLSFAMRRKLDEIRRAVAVGREISAVQPIIETQQAMSSFPLLGETLVETCSTRDGEHLFIFPFEGRLVHECLATLWAYRMGRKYPTTFSLTVNDYGMEFLAPRGFPYRQAFNASMFDRQNLVEDVLAAVNLSELARRQFREVARVAGLVNQNYRGRAHTSRQLQASASLLFDVFQRHDPSNLLVQQARREVLEQQFEQKRLATALERIRTSKPLWKPLPHPSPLAFPLVAERLGSRILSTQTLEERIERMVRQWENRSPSKSPAKHLNSTPSAESTGRRAAL